MDGSPLRVLLVLKHAGYIGVYVSLVEELAERGNHVHVAFAGRDPAGETTLVRLSERYSTITHGPAPARGLLDGWSSVAWLTRARGDLARYCHPRFAEVPTLRNRMASKVETHLEGAGGFDPITRRLALRQARRLHARIDADLAEQQIRKGVELERAIPISRRITDFLESQRPDVVLVSPLVDLASSLLEYLKAARQLGIPTGICVASWDNLSSKGLLRFVPERVFVWNEVQRQEAVELHDMPAGHVVATGAARFDEWFAQQPSTQREEFARKIGLAPRHPFVLYVCSSGFIVRDEAAVVSRWIESLRGAADERLRSLGVVIRPHPKLREPWKRFDTSRFENAVLWPSVGSSFTAAEARADFYDSIAHSVAVVGANTSAMIEAAIAGKSVYTWLAPEFSQEGTIHFRYLLHEHGGFLHVASSQEEHLQQLARGIQRGEDEAERTRSFVQAFVRPGGLERRATAIYADAVEEVATLRPPAGEAPSPPALVRLALVSVAASSTAALAARIGRTALLNRLPGETDTPKKKLEVKAARA
jgi:hypothetical protein